VNKLKSWLKEKIITSLPPGVINEINRRHMEGKKVYYSQEGEDVILERVFEGQDTGFFVDIGAHHPSRFSNTFSFYLKGWRGVNIDATPGSMIPFKIHRSEDINLEFGISESESMMDYYLFDEPALNTFSRERKEYLLKETPYKLIQVVQVKTKTLGQIMKEYTPSGKQVDFLTIDVEGLDYLILHSNDWTKYRPKVILTEDLDGSLERMKGSKLYSYLYSFDYELYARTHNTVFFKDKNAF
jgi:FkbM family methyltransferase